MKYLIAAILSLFSVSSLAIDENYKKNKSGGYEYTGGSHIRGCSNRFKIGVSNKKFVIECMKIDGIAVRHPQSIRTHTSHSGIVEIYVYGATTFHFKNGILDYIIN